MGLLAVPLQFFQTGVDLFPLRIALSIGEHLTERDIEGHKFIPQFSDPAGRRGVGRIGKLLIPLHGFRQNGVQPVLEGIVAHPLQGGLDDSPLLRSGPQVGAERGQIRRLHGVPAAEPGLCLCDRGVVKIFPVRDMDALAAQLTQHIVHQLIYLVRDADLKHFVLHGLQLRQGNDGRRILRRALRRLLLLQNRQAGVPVFHILSDHLELKPVIERLEDLLLRICEIRNFIGGGKERDRGDVDGFALIGVPALVERGQEGVEDTVGRLKNLV